MIDGCSLTKGSLGFIYCSRLVPARGSPTGEDQGVPRLEECDPARRMIHNSAATIGEQSLPDAFGVGGARNGSEACRSANQRV
jgi:hypothetical protein